MIHVYKIELDENAQLTRTGCDPINGDYLASEQWLSAIRSHNGANQPVVADIDIYTHSMEFENARRLPNDASRKAGRRRGRAGGARSRTPQWSRAG